MAFFKFRKAGDDAAGAAAQPESVEVLRRRAKHRLIGAAVLVGVGLVGFPLVFDTQPRPVPVDIPIDIPDRNKAKPLAMPAPAESPSSSQATTVAPAAPAVVAAPAAPVKPAASAAAPAKVAAADALDPREELVPQKPASRAAAPAARTASGAIKSETKPETRPEPKPEAKPDVKPEVKAEAKPAARPASRPDDGAKARALLEGKAPDAPAAPAERFVVQVGAFADADKAREVRQKLEKAGLKTYTHVADTKDGKRTRVRVGPFSTKAEADKAAERIKGLELPAAILTL